jgi:hypothetical protein
MTTTWRLNIKTGAEEGVDPRIHAYWSLVPRTRWRLSCLTIWQLNGCFSSEPAISVPIGEPDPNVSEVTDGKGGMCYSTMSAFIVLYTHA